MVNADVFPQNSGKSKLPTSLFLSSIKHPCHPTNHGFFLLFITHIITYSQIFSRFVHIIFHFYASRQLQFRTIFIMTNFKLAAITLISLSVSNAFVNSPSFGVNKQQTKLHSTAVQYEIDVRTGKRTGNSFLSEETRARGAAGNPIEKAKHGKCATSAFVDVYEYAAKIRAGEMTWEEVEKADLDTVSCSYVFICVTLCIFCGIHIIKFRIE